MTSLSISLSSLPPPPMFMLIDPGCQLHLISVKLRIIDPICLPFGGKLPQRGIWILCKWAGQLFTNVISSIIRDLYRTRKFRARGKKAKNRKLEKIHNYNSTNKKGRREKNSINNLIIFFFLLKGVKVEGRRVEEGGGCCCRCWKYSERLGSARITGEITRITRELRSGCNLSHHGADL